MQLWQGFSCYSQGMSTGEKKAKKYIRFIRIKLAWCFVFNILSNSVGYFLWATIFPGMSHCVNFSNRKMVFLTVFTQQLIELKPGSSSKYLYIYLTIAYLLYYTAILKTMKYHNHTQFFQGFADTETIKTKLKFNSSRVGSSLCFLIPDSGQNKCQLLLV